MSHLLTQSRLKELLNYDQETGIFTHVKTIRSRIIKGRVAGGVHKRSGYHRTRVEKILYGTHRLAWLYVHGELPSESVDHINGNKLDNRISNLRLASTSLNQQNKRKAQSNNKLGVLGVCRDGSRFKAAIKKQGRKIHLGSHATPELAHEAYLTAKREIHEGCTI